MYIESFLKRFAIYNKLENVFQKKKKIIFRNKRFNFFPYFEDYGIFVVIFLIAPIAILLC